MAVVSMSSSPSSSSSSSPEKSQQQQQQHSAMLSSSSSPSSSSLQKSKQQMMNPSSLMTKTKTTKTTTTTNTTTSWIWWLWWNLVLAIVFGSFAMTHWILYVYNTYIESQFQSLQWNVQRQTKEITYYARQCTVQDITTFNASDLILNPIILEDDDLEDENDDDIKENVKEKRMRIRKKKLEEAATTAYWHQLHHGFTVIPKVMTDNTMKQLRQHILQQNQIYGHDYFVLQNKNRYSFGLNTQIPIVAQAMKEITNPKNQLSSAVEKIMGSDPALVEMTAITVTYGAKNQHYHDDVVPDTSALMYTRSFDPLYSIFIQLQNTSADMGATGICPGMQYCSMGENVEDICETHGYPFINPKTGYWNGGDALLMNMNSYHRGTAYTKKKSKNNRNNNVEDRVMVILTLGPKPRPIGESRQISQGATMSLRYDMWGHTWSDLQNADKIMKWPWTILRAMGLFNVRKLKKTNNNNNGRDTWLWGYDYITNIYMRIANDPNFFDSEKLHEFINKGSYQFLPKFLHPIPIQHITKQELDSDEAWYYYLKATIHRIYTIHASIIIVFVMMYLLLVFLMNLITWIISLSLWSSSSTKRRTKISSSSSSLSTSPTTDGDGGGLKIALIRLIVWIVISYCLWISGRMYVDSTDWAKDIRQNRLYHSVMEYETTNFVNLLQQQPQEQQNGGDWMITTLPTRYDVLLEHRIGGSHYFGMFRDLITHGHYGNAQFQKLIQQTAITTMTTTTMTTTTTKVNETKDMDNSSTTTTTLTTRSIPFYHTPIVKKALVRYIFDTITLEQQGRFLKQGTTRTTRGSWYLMKQDDIYQYIAETMTGVQIPLVGHVLIRNTLEPMITELRYGGLYQHTVLASKYSIPYLQSLQQKLYQSFLDGVIPITPIMDPTTTSITKTNQQVHVIPNKFRVSSDGVTLLPSSSSMVDLLKSKKRNMQFRNSKYVVVELPLPLLANKINNNNNNHKTTTRMFTKDKNNGDMMADDKTTTKTISTVPNPIVQEPYHDAWIRSGSLVEVISEEENNNFVMVGRIVHITADASYHIWTSHDDVEEYSHYEVYPFHTEHWLGQYVSVRINTNKNKDDDNYGEKNGYEDCIVVAIHSNKKKMHDESVQVDVQLVRNQVILQDIEVTDLLLQIPNRDDYDDNQIPPDFDDEDEDYDEDEDEEEDEDD